LFFRADDGIRARNVTGVQTCALPILAEQGLNVPEMPMLAGLDIGSMMRTMGSLSFAMQVGQGAGTLSREVFGGTDVGLPLLAEPALLLVPANVAEFADGLDAPGTRCGTSWRCARQRTRGCSPMCRGCVRTCSAPWRTTRAGSRSTWSRWRSRCAA